MGWQTSEGSIGVFEKMTQKNRLIIGKNGRIDLSLQTKY